VAPVRILVTYGSTRGGTEGLARMVGDGLHAEGFEVDVRPARQAGQLDGYGAVIVGGALYDARWHKDARRFVRRHARELKSRPVWLFASGPLDDRASHGEVRPVKGVKAVMDQVAARGQVTFGGRLAPDATGLVASAMAKKRAGDWRDAGQVRAWAVSIAAQLRQDAAPAA
jgi:menaquinone-dependent protoporphyrinogen oxidase